MTKVTSIKKAITVKPVQKVNKIILKKPNNIKGMKFDSELFYFNLKGNPKKYMKSIPDFVKNGVLSKGTTFGVTFSKQNCKGGFAMQKGAFKRSLTSQLKSRGLKVSNTFGDNENDAKQSSVESLFFKIDSIQ